MADVQEQAGEVQRNSATQTYVDGYHLLKSIVVARQKQAT